MAVCKFCGQVFSWGLDGERWTPLIPAGEEGEVEREYQDHNGVLRASHRAVCVGGKPSVRISRLQVPVKAENCLPPVQSIAEPKPPRAPKVPAEPKPKRQKKLSRYRQRIADLEAAKQAEGVK